MEREWDLLHGNGRELESKTDSCKPSMRTGAFLQARVNRFIPIVDIMPTQRLIPYFLSSSAQIPQLTPNFLRCMRHDCYALFLDANLVSFLYFNEYVM